MITLWNGDCLEEMKKIPDGSIDLVLTDPPYGTTVCKWDTIIPFEPMWEQLKRVTKKNGAIVLFGQEPFVATFFFDANVNDQKDDILFDVALVYATSSCSQNDEVLIFLIKTTILIKFLS